MLPLEPARFSTTTGTARISESFWPTTRAAISGAPPGGIGTISLIGRDGYWASASELASTASTNRQAANRCTNFAVIDAFFRIS